MQYFTKFKQCNAFHGLGCCNDVHGKANILNSFIKIWQIEYTLCAALQTARQIGFHFVKSPFGNRRKMTFNPT